MRALLAVVATMALACKGAARPTPAPTCAEASGKIARGMVKVREDIGTAGLDPAPEIAQLCTDDDWEPEVVRCYASADGPRELRACSDQLSADQRAHAREVQESLYRRASEVGAGRDGATGVEECDDYVRAAEAFEDCPSIPPAVKDAIRQSVASMRETWAGLGDDEGSRRAAALGCSSAAEALRQSLVAQGC